jgi:allantoicase
MLDFTRYPDLAARSLAGSVISTNDELFTPRQNLITPGPPYTPRTPSGIPGRSMTVGRPGDGARWKGLGDHPVGRTRHRARRGRRYGVLPWQLSAVGEGWKNARRRGPGNDWAIFATTSRCTRKRATPPWG